MTFTWPLALLFVLAGPVVAAVYLLQLRRRRKQAVTYSSVALLRSVIPNRSRWRRHVPTALVIAGLSLLGIAAARPQMKQSVPLSRTSIILALDVSRSMCAADVEPNRLTVAEEAARNFVRHRPAGTRIGLVVFSGSAQLVLPPTNDTKALTSAIDSLTTGGGTAIGAAMLKGLDAIAGVNPNVKPVGDAPASTANSGIDSALGGQESSPPTTAPPAQKDSGSYVPDIIVLLTDGANNRGITPLDAVPYAVERRVRVYTIGFGTPDIAPLACTAEQLGGDPGFGFRGGGFERGSGGGGFGGRSPLRADLPTLQQVADSTGGVAYIAQNASQLEKGFTSLPKDVTIQKVRHEVSAPIAAVAAVLIICAVAASIRWSPYP